MRKRMMTCCFAAAALLALPVAAQMEPPQAATPLPSRQRQPGPPGGEMRMRMPGPAPIARPDLGKWWKNSEVAAEIGLTEAQGNQIEQAFFEHRLKLIDMNADVERNEARLQPLMEADQPDEAKISAQLDQLLAARARLEKANMMMMVSIRKVLSVDQWKKLEAYRTQRYKMRAPEPGGAMERMGPGPARPAPRPPENDPFN